MVVSLVTEQEEEVSAAFKRVKASLTRAGISYHGKRTSKAGCHVYVIEYQGRKYTLKTYQELEQFARMVTLRKQPGLGMLNWKLWQDDGIRGTVEEIVHRSEQVKRLHKLLALQLKGKK